MSRRTSYIVSFNQGSRGLAFEAGTTVDPHEKGAALKAYRRGRAIYFTDQLRTCTRYMRTGDLEKLNERLAELYRQTLVDMYGEQGAIEFLEQLEEV